MVNRLSANKLIVIIENSVIKEFDNDVKVGKAKLAVSLTLLLEILVSDSLASKLIN